MKLSVALADCLGAGGQAVLVTVERVHGSTPREAGATLMVTQDGCKGTIGGGALELEAICEARRMLADARRRSVLDIPLGPAIGQCCGGRVELLLEAADADLVARLRQAEEAGLSARAPVFIFGAGHTGQALAAALEPLPFAVRVVDTRPALLAGLPPSIATIASAVPEAMVEQAPAGAAYVIVTHDHALDFMIGAAALRRRDSLYVGMIGSATKRERFRRYAQEQGLAAEFRRLVMPIGGAKLRDKRPEIIAALTAAELLVQILGTPVDNAVHRLCTCPQPVQ